jgi:type VI secretion system protein
MPGHTLLTRIRHPEYAIARRSISDAETRESVVQHLRSMCSTRRGTMVTAPDFGVIDVSELVYSFPDAIALMARTMRQSIMVYEPRLTNVVIRHLPGDGTDLTLRYEITAQLLSGDHKTPVKFETSIDPARKINVR